MKYPKIADPQDVRRLQLSELDDYRFIAEFGFFCLGEIGSATQAIDLGYNGREVIDLSLSRSILTKLAALRENVRLMEHQRRAIDKIEQVGSQIVAHGTGTGKTLTGIGAIEKLRKKKRAKRTLVIVPASLRTNFSREGVLKFTDRSVQVLDKGSSEIDPKAEYVIVSSTLFAQNPEKFMGKFDSLIVDEAHNARNTNTKLYKGLKKIAPEMKHRILLTASPFNNSPADLAPLLNLAKGRKDYDASTFDREYVKPVMKQTGFLGLGGKVRTGEVFSPDTALSQDLKQYFDYEKGSGRLPKTTDETIRVPMTDEQLRAYMYAWNRMPPHVRRAIRKDILPDKREATNFFAAIANARIASNNPAALLEEGKHRGPMSSAKVRKLLELLEEREPGKLKDLVYSNYNEHGASIIAKALEQKGIPYSMIEGSMNRRAKDQQIADFKQGKTDVFITTPTGKEGISLPNVRREFIFDPHWNPEVTRQAIGRGVRADSISPKVDIKRLIAVEPERRILWFKRKPPQSVEEWVDSVARKKEELRDQVLSSLGGGSGV